MDFIMKKFVVLCLAMVMVLSMSLSTFAADLGAFVKSPSLNPAPEVIYFDADNEDCDADIKVTAYSERDTLDEEARKRIEEAYKQIVNDDEENNPFAEELKKLAEELGLDLDQLSVSDLFDISATNCDDHDDHKGFTITLKADTLENFLGLMQFDGEKWITLEVIEWDEFAKTVTFHCDELYPVAFIVNNDPNRAPQTGDYSALYLGIALVAAVGLVVVLVSSKKKA